MMFYIIPWPSTRFHGLPWSSMRFHGLFAGCLRSLRFTTDGLRVTILPPTWITGILRGRTCRWVYSEAALYWIYVLCRVGMIHSISYKYQDMHSLCTTPEFPEIGNVGVLEFSGNGKHRKIRSFRKSNNEQINIPRKLTGVPGCVRTVEWILTSRLHKQVVIEIRVITNLRSNSWRAKLYYLYYWGCCAQTMFVCVWYLLVNF